MNLLFNIGLNMNIAWNINQSQPQCIIVVAPLPHAITAIPTTRLPPDILNKLPALNELRQKQYLASRALLAELLFQLLNIVQLPEMVTSNNGRPQFIQPDLPDFNISHSDDQVMIALMNHGRIGIDLEVKRERRRLLDLARYSFSPLEVSWLEQLDESSKTAGFWQLWTIRESILKLIAKGVWQMKEIELNPLTQQINSTFAQPLYCLTHQNDHISWSISTDHPLDPNHVTLFHVEPDCLTWIPQKLPALTAFQTIESDLK